MNTFKEQMLDDLDVFFDTTAFAENIVYNGQSLVAIVSDPEEVPGSVQFGHEEPGVMKKTVCVRKSDLASAPREGDEVSLALEKEAEACWWRVSRVKELWYEYRIQFERYSG